MSARRPDPGRILEAARRAEKRRAPRDRPTTLPAPVPMPPEHLAALRAAGGCEPDVRGYTLGECSILIGTDPEGGRQHLSIAHPRRLPEWAEVSEARYRLMRPNAVVAMVLPPARDYVNEHPNCFHLWELPPGIARPYRRRQR